MYVLTEDEYQLYKSGLTQKTPDQSLAPSTVKCPEDGREFPNSGMLGHHLKTHVNGFQCNICGKVFKTKRALVVHLKQHSPQVQPSTHSIFDNATSILPAPETPAIASKPTKIHKQRSVLNFNSNKWLTLK